MPALTAALGMTSTGSPEYKPARAFVDLAVSLAQAQGNINNATIGAVVATSAGNKVTFENYARSHEEGQLGAGDDPIYYFQMYGPAGNAAQTWHSQWTTGANR